MQNTKENRETNLIDVLVEMARGNFFHRMPLSGKKDFMDAVMFLVNRIGEETHSHLIHQAFTTKDEMSQFLFPLVIQLDDQGAIESANAYAGRALSQEGSALRGRNFMDLMSGESQRRWSKTLKRMSKTQMEDAIVHLDIRINEGVLLSKNYFVHSLERDGGAPPKYLVGTVLYSPGQTMGKGTLKKKEAQRFQMARARRLDLTFVQKVDDFMGLNLQEGIPNIKALARVFFVNEHKLNLGFRTVFGKSVLQQFNHKQIEEAKKLLLDSSMMIHEIAHKVGVRDPAYFCRFFKKHTGLTPREFRRNGPHPK